MVQNNAWNNPRRADRQRQPNRVHHHRDERCCPNQRRPAELPLDLRGRALGPPRRCTNLPTEVGQILSAPTSIDYNYPTTGVWDASYDICLDSTPKTTGVNQQEIMIWFNHQGSIQPVGSPVGNTTIEGKNFVVWDGSNGMNNAMAYVATEPIEVWSFDVMSFVDHTATMEPITDSWYLTSIRAGLEPWSDGVGLGVDSFSAKVN